MKSLLSVINEVLTKKLKEGTPLTELAIGKTLFTQRGAKKFLNVEAIEKDFKNIESDVKNLKNTTFCTTAYGKTSDIDAKACFLILSQIPYSKDYRKMEQAAKDAAQKYSIDNIHDVKIIDVTTSYEDIEGDLWITIKLSKHANLSIGMFLDGFVVGRYKTVWVGNGVDIYRDEIEKYDDARTAQWLDRGPDVIDIKL